MKIKRVVIAGGTHGNEYTGAYFIQRFGYLQLPPNRSGIEINTLLANPQAFTKGVRFIDVDLNRSFLMDDLNNMNLATYEADRAKVINMTLGPKGNPKTDCMIDLHTTTANMGITLILIENNEFNFKMAAYLRSLLPEISICYLGTQEDRSDMISVAPSGFGLEIGPIPNGVIRHDFIEKAETVIKHAIEFIHMFNLNEPLELNNELDVFEHVKVVDYPTDEEGHIVGMVHKDLQDNDYHLLKKGDPIFITLKGEIIYYDEEENLYPVFINEAGYYYKKTAFSLARKRILRQGGT